MAGNVNGRPYRVTSLLAMVAHGTLATALFDISLTLMAQRDPPLPLMTMGAAGGLSWPLPLTLIMISHCNLTSEWTLL